jgi:hypothetical protein
MSFKELQIFAVVLALFAITAAVATATATAEESERYRYEYLPAMRYGEEDSPNAIFRLTDNERGVICYSQFKTISCIREVK